jgi:sigma-B regulation protein RsbU (phosphoserine phosphatase)
MTALIALIDHRRGEVSWVNAGHTFPFVSSPATGALGSLAVGGTPFGIDEGTTFARQRRAVASGGRLIFFTDGLIEGCNRDGQMYGERRLARVISGSRARRAAELRDEIVEHARAFFDGQPAEDDITVVVAELTGAERAPATARPRA